MSKTNKVLAPGGIILPPGSHMSFKMTYESLGLSVIILREGENDVAYVTPFLHIAELPTENIPQMKYAVEKAISEGYSVCRHFIYINKKYIDITDTQDLLDEIFLPVKKECRRMVSFLPRPTEGDAFLCEILEGSQKEVPCKERTALLEKVISSVFYRVQNHIVMGPEVGKIVQLLEARI